MAYTRFSAAGTESTRETGSARGCDPSHGSVLDTVSARLLVSLGANASGKWTGLGISGPGYELPCERPEPAFSDAIASKA